MISRYTCCDLFEDYILATGAGVIVGSVIVSVMLLSRYRALVAETSRSATLAKDLWSALEGRFRKQDERIVDLMARVEVYGAKSQLGKESPVTRTGPEEKSSAQVASVEAVSPSTDVERMILVNLLKGSKTSPEIKDLIGRSREHAARLMKVLFDRGYVVRNDLKRPFVYEITESGRRHLTETRPAGT